MRKFRRYRAGRSRLVVLGLPGTLDPGLVRLQGLRHAIDAAARRLVHAVDRFALALGGFFRFLGGAAHQFAARGGGVVQRLVLTLAAMRGSSHKVVEIVSVIDGLALQTNVLALDAAVAAARAGAHGDDFNRIASQVLALAQRSATAAHEVTALVHGAVAEIDGGAQSVAEMGDNMAEIIASLEQVGAIIVQLGESTMAQVQGVEGAQLAILAVEQMTRHSLELVRQAAADANSLQRQAVHLSEAVALFRLEAPAGDGTPAPPQPAGSARVVRLRLASVRN